MLSQHKSCLPKEKERYWTVVFLAQSRNKERIMLQCILNSVTSMKQEKKEHFMASFALWMYYRFIHGLYMSYIHVLLHFVCSSTKLVVFSSWGKEGRI